MIYIYIYFFFSKYYITPTVSDELFYSSPTVSAEVLAIREVLLLACSWGIPLEVVECDAFNAVVYMDVKTLLNRVNSNSCHFVPCIGKRVAHILASSVYFLPHDKEATSLFISH